MISWNVLTPTRATLAGVPVGAGRPVVVIGALNVSPESFYAGSIRTGRDELLAAALAMVEAGAAIIDVGARSTAPYRAAEITEREEAARLAPAIELLVAKLPVPVSADTPRPGPARAALEAGARILNDVSGLADPCMAELAAAHAVGVILMASPRSSVPSGEPVGVVRELLRAAVQRARGVGIPDDRIVLDPGIGFFRDEGVPWPEWDVRILGGLRELTALGRPLCVGVSRKSFIGALAGRPDAADRLAGSLAATTVAVVHGAAAVRTHDVKETVDAVRVAERLRPPDSP